MARNGSSVLPPRVARKIRVVMESSFLESDCAPAHELLCQAAVRYFELGRDPRAIHELADRFAHLFDQEVLHHYRAAIEVASDPTQAAEDRREASRAAALLEPVARAILGAR